MVLNLVPLQLPGYAAISPNFALMAVYYWALHRPSLLPIGAVFLIGLLQDFLSGGFIGQNAAILLVVYIIAVSQARFFYGKSLSSFGGALWWCRWALPFWNGLSLPYFLGTCSRPNLRFTKVL